jgi:hypothetical protein
MATGSDEPTGDNEDFGLEGDEAPRARSGKQGGPHRNSERAPSASNNGRGRSDVPTKWAVDRLDERERRFSFLAAGGALLFGVIIYVAETQNAHFRLAKNQLTPQTTLIVGLVAAGLLVATTLIGRRALVGFVALFAGIAFTNSFFALALPFLGFAFWLLWRSYKVQRQASIDLRQARAVAVNTKSPATTRSPAGSKRATGPSKSAGKGPTKPQANKRYTPKAAPVPPPKLSRRDRKAANASD